MGRPCYRQSNGGGFAPSFFVPRTLGRTWGTRPPARVSLLGKNPQVRVLHIHRFLHGNAGMRDPTFARKKYRICVKSW
jgi:hypothetical protein